jgi:hypothetical protein
MFKRILIYLNEMYPITSFLGSFLTTITLQHLMLKLNNQPINFSLTLVLSSISVVLFSLLIRVMDEFKDLPDDLINFPNRPLPSGRVLKKDLHVLGWFTVVTSLSLSFYVSLDSGIAALVVLFYSFLMLKWFWMENKIRNSLPLALVTHHPIVILHFAYLAVSLYSVNGLQDFSTVVPALLLALLFTNWEISRKTRYPEDETNYTTYSKIWGMKVPLIISISFLVIIFLTNSFLFFKFKTNIWFLAFFNIVFFQLVFPWARPFYGAKNSKPFKFHAENMILFIFGSWLIHNLIF